MSTILIISLIFSIYFVMLFFARNVGLSIPIFIIPLMTAAVYLLKDKIKNNKAKLWLIPICLLSCTYLLFDNSFFNVLNLMVIPIFIFIMLVELLNDKIDFKSLVCEIIYMLLIPFVSFTQIGEDIKNSFKIFKKDKEEKDISGLLKGICITACLVIFIIALLASADSDFSSIFSSIIKKIIGSFIKINIWGIIGRIIVGLGVFLYLASLLKYVIFEYEMSTEEENKEEKQDTLTIKMILTALNLVYLLFLSLQVKNIINTWNTDMDFAFYARQGFFQLLVVSIINFVTILIAKAKEKFDKNKNYIKVSSLIMIFFTLLLIICAGLRMYAYESEYGYTLLRLLVYFTLLAEIIALIPTTLYILNKKINLTKSYMLIGVSVYLVMNFANLNNIIAQRNVNKYLETGKIDLYYLGDLGTDTTYQLLRLLKETENIKDSNQIENVNTVKFNVSLKLEDRYEDLKQLNDIRGFNFSKYISKKMLENTDFDKYKADYLKEVPVGTNNTFEEYNNGESIDNTTNSTTTETSVQTKEISYYDGVKYGAVGVCKYKGFAPKFSNPDNYKTYDYTQDMEWENKIYHKAIYDYNTYTEYKNRWNGILDMTESDFANNFMIITAIENVSMEGLTVKDIFNDKTTLYISLTKIGEGVAYDSAETCISIIIPKYMSRDKITTDVDIERESNSFYENSLISTTYTDDGLISKDVASQKALKYIQDLSKKVQFLKEYTDLQNYTEVISVNRMYGLHPSNYWDLVSNGEKITNDNLKLQSWTITAYDVVLAKADDSQRESKVHVYINGVTGDVQGGYIE